MFVESEHRRQVRRNIPKIDNAIADVDAGIEEADEIGVADARPGRGVNDGRQICRDVVGKIGSGQCGKSATEAVTGDQQFLAAEGFGLNQLAQVFAHCFVHDLKTLMNGAASGNGAVRSRSEIEIIKPVLEVFGAAEGHDQPV